MSRDEGQEQGEGMIHNYNAEKQVTQGSDL